MGKTRYSFLEAAMLFAALCFLPATLVAQLNEKVGIGVRLQLDSTRGYKITEVLAIVPDGPAQAAGLQEGDFILKVNEQSTRDVVLQDVVNMIVGKEGTIVKLVVERKGSTRNYTITRGKYKYGAAYYSPADKDNEFCKALSRLMNDAAYNFANTMDTIHPVDGNGNYVSKVKVPGVESVGMENSWGISCLIGIGAYATTNEVSAAGAKIIEQIKTCFPDYYYDPVVEKNGSVSVSIGNLYANGYESPILQLYTVLEKSNQKQNLILRINGGKATRYYKITTEAENNSMATALKTIYNDIPNNFRNVKGTRHEIEGGLFNSGSTWYEINPVPDGARSCSLAEGDMSLGASNCRCGFHLGTNADEAIASFKNIYEKTRDALGSDFVYSFDYSRWDLNIPKNAKSVIIFGAKKKRIFESDIPQIVLLFLTNEDKSYSVNMLFYKFGF